MQIQFLTLEHKSNKLEVMQDKLEALRHWYYSPGEVLRGIGFYVNPYQQYPNTQFRHVFAFDANYNLFVGQYSVYHEHIESMFDLKDKREYGMIYPKNAGVTPIYSSEDLVEYNSKIESLNVYTPLIEFQFIETKNIIYFNQRLKRLAQRFYDYGMPENTTFVSTQTDLWFPTINSVLSGKFMKKPTKTNS